MIETSPVEVFVNLLLYNKVRNNNIGKIKYLLRILQIPFEGIQIDIQSVDFSVSGSLEYNNNKYEYQHASSLNELYQLLVSKFNQDYEKYQLKMPPQSFFVARGRERLF